MTSLEHQPNNHLSYFKVAIRLAVFCFFLSVLLLGSLKVLSKKKQSAESNPDNPVINQVVEGNTKSIEDFEKSELLKGLFKKEGEIFPDKIIKDSIVSEIKETEIKNQELTVTPEPTPKISLETVIAEVTTDTLEPIVSPSLENSNKIFDFDQSKNYQVFIAKYIAKQKIANLNSEELATIIITESQAIKLNPIITTLLISLESQFNRYSESSNGRVGLLQIHPDEAKLITKKINLPFLGTVSLYHPIYNIRLGLQLLVEKKAAAGTWEEAIKKFSKLGNENLTNQYLGKILTQVVELEQ